MRRGPPSESSFVVANAIDALGYDGATWPCGEDCCFSQSSGDNGEHPHGQQRTREPSFVRKKEQGGQYRG